MKIIQIDEKTFEIENFKLYLSRDCLLLLKRTNTNIEEFIEWFVNSRKISAGSGDGMHYLNVTEKKK